MGSGRRCGQDALAGVPACPCAEAVELLTDAAGHAQDGAGQGPDVAQYVEPEEDRGCEAVYSECVLDGLCV